MTCRCTFHSPFLFAQHPRESEFMKDSHFYKGAHTGMTAGQISTASVERITRETGRNPGSIYGISAHADRLTEQAIAERQKRSRAPSHNRSKA